MVRNGTLIRHAFRGGDGGGPGSGAAALAVAALAIAMILPSFEAGLMTLIGCPGLLAALLATAFIGAIAVSAVAAPADGEGVAADAI